MSEFVHLRVHSEYSLIDGLINVKALVAECVAQQTPAVAVTDVCNLFGLVKFYKAALGAGVKPIIGADVPIQVPGRDPGTFDTGSLLLLAMNDVGYGNLVRLISRGYTEGREVDGPSR